MYIPKFDRFLKFVDACAWLYALGMKLYTPTQEKRRSPQKTGLPAHLRAKAERRTDNVHPKNRTGNHHHIQ